MEIQDIKNFFVNTQKLSLFDRIFKWNKIKDQIIDVYDELKNLDLEIKKTNSLEQELTFTKENLNSNNKQINEYKIKINELEYKISEIEKNRNEKQIENSKLEENLNNSKEKIMDLNQQIHYLKEKIESLININKELEKIKNNFEQSKEERTREHNEKINKLNTQIENYEKRRTQLDIEEKEKEILKFEEMKKTWQKHELNVENKIKQICNLYIIPYIDKEKYPYKGKPDNCIEIANEYIIFDAKSPANDDLNNFPTYIKNQTEKAKKYAKEDNVKKDIFLVVPTNTINKLNQTYYNMSDYNVYIITTDSLEPIILSLKKIEDYEFAEKLSPEDRDSICRIIGRFAHTTKRRLQIDNFFAHESIGLLENCNILPPEILEKSVEYEKGSKLNPSLEKRKKIIQLKDLNKSSKEIQKNLEHYNLNTKIKENDIDNIKLYDSSDE